MSGGESRRSSRAFENWRGMRCRRTAKPSYSPEIVEQCRRVRRHDPCAVRTAICVDVLHRLFAPVLLDGAVIVVMMKFAFQMHRGVRSAFAVAICGT